MGITTFLKAISPIILSYGPGVIGWLVAVALGWYIVHKKKESVKQLIDEKDKYISEVKSMNFRLEILNEKHASIVAAVTEARVDDLKELTADYNKLASDTLRTMDRFVLTLEAKNSIRGDR